MKAARRTAVAPMLRNITRGPRAQTERPTILLCHGGRLMGRQHDPLLSLPDKSGVLYVRLYQRMRALILEGSWPPGMRLPSSRTLAADLGIARNTASLAIDQLLADGWVETRR